MHTVYVHGFRRHVQHRLSVYVCLGVYVVLCQSLCTLCTLAHAYTHIVYIQRKKKSRRRTQPESFTYTVY